MRNGAWLSKLAIMAPTCVLLPLISSGARLVAGAIVEGGQPSSQIAENFHVSAKTVRIQVTAQFANGTWYIGAKVGSKLLESFQLHGFGTRYSAPVQPTMFLNSLPDNRLPGFVIDVAGANVVSEGFFILTSTSVRPMLIGTSPEYLSREIVFGGGVNSGFETSCGHLGKSFDIVQTSWSGLILC